MSEVPAELKYLKSHEWLRMEDDGSAVIGITDHAQEMLGDLVYIELPEVGQNLDAGEDCVVLESVKAASDVYAPVSGEVLAVNEALADNPELVNQSPYQDGWLFKIKPSAEDAGDLLDADAYNKLLSEESE